MRIQIFRLDDLSDEDLIVSAQNGSNEAVEILVKRYFPLAKKRARQYYLNGSEKEDIFQEAMVGLYNAIKFYNPESKVHFHGFADLCVTRSVVAAIRRHCRLKHGPLNNSVSFQIVKVENILGHKNIDPLLILLRREKIKAINDLLTKFEKEVIKRHLQGFSYHQIASALKISKKAIDNALQRVRRKAKRYLDENKD